MNLQKLTRLATSIALCACLAVGVTATVIGGSEPAHATLALGISLSEESAQVSTVQTLAEDKTSLEPKETAAESDVQEAEEEAAEADVQEVEERIAEDSESSGDNETDAAESDETSTSACDTSEGSNLTFPITGTVNSGGSGLNMRNGPGASCDVMASIPNETVLTLTDLESGWYQTSYNGSTGYVNSQYILLGGNISANSNDSADSSDNSASSIASSSGNSSTSSSTVSSSSTSSSSSDSDSSNSEASDTAAALVEYAKQFLGCSYVYATAGPTTFDCSGFTYYVFAHFGYTLSRSSAAQYNNGEVIEMDESQMQVGDLLLWRTYGSSDAANHAGIYIGNGQYIHASSSSGCVTISSLSTVSSQRYLVGVRRIIS